MDKVKTRVPEFISRCVRYVVVTHERSSIAKEQTAARRLKHAREREIITQIKMNLSISIRETRMRDVFLMLRRVLLNRWQE